MTILERASMALVAQLVFDYRELSVGHSCKVKHINPSHESDIGLRVDYHGMIFTSDKVSVDVKDESYGYRLWTLNTTFGRNYFKLRHDERHRDRDIIIDSVSSNEIRGEELDGKFIIKKDGDYIKVSDRGSQFPWLYKIYI